MRLTPSFSNARFAMAVVFITGILLPLLVGNLARGLFAGALAVLAASCWVALPLLYPMAALSSGHITSKGGTTQRATDPVRFWVGLATYELLLCFFAVLTVGVLRMYLVPAKP